MAFNPVAVILRATQLVRGWGVKVTFEPGWETRGNGYRSDWVGGIEHHTGTASAGETNVFPTRTVLRDGHAGLSGPLCNSAGPWDGSVHVVAAQAANHAGASGGRSMGPLPVTTLFNPRVFGHEIDYPGSSPMSTAQYRTAVLWGRALLVALVEAGQIPWFDAERIRLHYETSITGKWDAGYKPGTPIDAEAFRRAIAKPPEEDDDMQPGDEFYASKWTKPGTWGNYLLQRAEDQDEIQKGVSAMQAQLAGLRVAVDKLAGAVAGDDLTADELKAAVNAGVAEALAAGIELTVGTKEQ